MTLGEFRKKLYLILQDNIGTKGNIIKVPEDLLWNPRGRPTPTQEDYAAAFREIVIQLVPNRQKSEQMLVDLSVKIESKNWRCENSDNSPWMHIDFLDKNLHKIEIEGSMHWFPLAFKPNQISYRYQQKTLMSDRWLDVESVRIWTGAGYAQNTNWYKNWLPHMIYARLRQVVTSSRRRLKRYKS